MGLVVASLASSFAVAASAADPELKPRFFQSNGVRIGYYEVGAGDPVVLLHGFTINSRVNWEMPGILSDLRRDFRVIAVDLRGHGQSEKPREAKKYGMEVVDDVVRLLDHLQIRRAHLVGYSMGGFITSKILTTYPERVISATLGGAGWGRAEDKPPFLDDLAESLEQGKGIGPLLVALTPAGYEPPSEENLKFANQMLNLTNDQKALAAMIRGMPAFAIPRESLEKNHVPTLSLIGELDPLKVGVDAMVGVKPDFKVVVIPKADHMNAFYAPQFTKSLRQFLEVHRLQPAAAIAK